jgi:hypothetical protein
VWYTTSDSSCGSVDVSVIHEKIRFSSLPITVSLVPELATGASEPETQALVGTDLLTDASLFQVHAPMPTMQTSFLTRGLFQLTGMSETRFIRASQAKNGFVPGIR